MSKNIIYYNTPKFTGRHVPIEEIASGTGKSPAFIREAMKLGILNIGYAIKSEESTQYKYFCPDKKVWEETGYFNENPGGES